MLQILSAELEDWVFKLPKAEPRLKVNHLQPAKSHPAETFAARATDLESTGLARPTCLPGFTVSLDLRFFPDPFLGPILFLPPTSANQNFSGLRRLKRDPESATQEVCFWHETPKKRASKQQKPFSGMRVGVASVLPVRGCTWELVWRQTLLL